MSYSSDKLGNLLKINQDFYLDLDCLLGEGQYGSVFKGYQVSKNRTIAIKVVESCEDYAREVEVLKILSLLIHPNIMGFYGFEKQEDKVYLFMQLCSKGSLTKLIEKGIPELTVLKLFRQLIEGMCYINAKGKMHRDLKPDNILIGGEQDIKISDFGLAGDLATSNKNSMGTALYAAPQMFLDIMNCNYSEKCDVWGAGLILYQMLTGKRLFNLQTIQQLRNEWLKFEKGENMISYPPQLHPNWEYFTNIMLTFNWQKRPTFHQVLEKFKKVFSKMEKEIKNKQLLKNQNAKVERVQQFLDFDIDKYNLLILIYDNFTQKDIRIRNEFQYFIIMLCLAQYLVHIKKMIRNIKYRNLRVNDDDEQTLAEQGDSDFDMVLDKFMNLLQNKQNFFTYQMKTLIIPKLMDYYPKKPESAQILKQLGPLNDLAKQISQDSYDTQETYQKEYKELLTGKMQIIFSGRAQFSIQQLQMYRVILLGALLHQKFPNQRYLTKGCIQNYLQKSANYDKQQLLAEIQQLRAQAI